MKRTHWFNQLIERIDRQLTPNSNTFFHTFWGTIDGFICLPALATGIFVQMLTCKSIWLDITQYGLLPAGRDLNGCCSVVNLDSDSYHDIYFSRAN